MSASHHPLAVSGTHQLVALTDEALAQAAPGIFVVETARGPAGFVVSVIRLGAAEDKHGKPYTVPVADGWMLGDARERPLTYAAADLHLPQPFLPADA